MALLYFWSIYFLVDLKNIYWKNTCKFKTDKQTNLKSQKNDFLYQKLSFCVSLNEERWSTWERFTRYDAKCAEGCDPILFKSYPPFLQPPLFWEFHPPDLSTYPSAPVPLGGRQSLTIINRLKRLTIMHTSMNFIFPAKLDLITSKQILISF